MYEFTTDLVQHQYSVLYYATLALVLPLILCHSRAYTLKDLANHWFYVLCNLVHHRFNVLCNLVQNRFYVTAVPFHLSYSAMTKTFLDLIVVWDLGYCANYFHNRACGCALDSCIIVPHGLSSWDINYRDYLMVAKGLSTWTA